ncbi:MAG: YceI family protein [Methylococcaceae bacterium]
MNKMWLALAMLSVVSISVLAADTYSIDPRHTFPSFEINHLGFSNQRGRFNETSGTILLDTSAATGSLQVAINTASISTGLTELEDKLRSKEFLDAALYPQISFISDKFLFKDEKLIGIDGNFSLHGVTKPLHLTVDYFICGLNVISLKKTCGANASTTIKRSDFGVDKFVPAIGDEVKIQIQIEAVKE